jgi:hypothetical protein
VKAPEEIVEKKKKILAMKATPFTLMNGFLYKLGSDDILRRYSWSMNGKGIMEEAHNWSTRWPLPSRHNCKKYYSGWTLVADSTQRLSVESEKMQHFLMNGFTIKKR